MKLKKLSPAEFDRVANETGMEPSTIQMVRDVLVYGRPQTAVAAEHGMSKQRIFKAVTAIEKKYFTTEGDGDALVSAELLLPEKIALELAAISSVMEKRPLSKPEKDAIDSLMGALERVRQTLEG